MNLARVFILVAWGVWCPWVRSSSDALGMPMDAWASISFLGNAHLNWFLHRCKQHVGRTRGHFWLISVSYGV